MGRSLICQASDFGIDGLRTGQTSSSGSSQLLHQDLWPLSQLRSVCGEVHRKLNHPLLSYPPISFFPTLVFQSRPIRSHTGPFMTLAQSSSQAQPYGFISQGPRSEALEEINACMEKNQLWLRKTKRKAFYTAVVCEDFRAGADSLLQVSVDSIQRSGNSTSYCTLDLVLSFYFIQ